MFIRFYYKLHFEIGFVNLLKDRMHSECMDPFYGLGRMILNYDKIVIGSSLEALMFAFNNQLPVFFSEAERPFRFDFVEPSLDLSDLNLENDFKNELKTINNEFNNYKKKKTITKLKIKNTKVTQLEKQIIKFSY